MTSVIGMEWTWSISVVLLGLGLCIVLHGLLRQRTLFKGIPEIVGYPIFGIVHLLTTITGSLKAHHEVLQILLEVGPVSQANFLGQKLLVVNDPLVLKAAFDKIRGKGIFHVSCCNYHIHHQHSSHHNLTLKYYSLASSIYVAKHLFFGYQ